MFFVYHYTRDLHLKMIVLLLFGLIIILIGAYLASISKYWKARHIPYLIKYPLVASAQLLSLQVSIGSYLEKVYNVSNDKLVAFHILGQPGILLRDPELIKQILVKDFNSFQDKTLLPNFEEDPIGGRVLFKLPNPEWKMIRRQMTSAFSTGKLKNMFPKMDQVGRNLVDNVREHEGEVMDVKELCCQFSIDVISSCMFSIDGNCFKDENSVSRQAARNIFACDVATGIQFCYHYFAPALVKLFRMSFVNRSAIAFVQKMFEDIQEFRTKKKVIYMDFADTLLKMLEGEKYYRTPDEVVAQAAQMWIAGFETVGSTIMFALYELSRNLDIQQKLREDIISNINMNDDKFSYDAINNMEYLEMVVCETLRMYPIVPFTDRKASKDYIIPGTNMTISKGTNIYVAYMGLHYDPTLFPDPHQFYPQRFSSKNKQSIRPSSYLPFSEGPRNCMGARLGKLSVKNAIVNIVANFAIEPTPYSGVTFDGRSFTLVPEVPIKLTFRKISE